jgi:capsular exopolysaccharide synthesis family protein
MTTLPTTTSIRLPKRAGAGNQPLAMPSTPMGPIGMPVAQPLLTPADVWRVIRGNFWIIVATCIVAGMVGFGLYWWQAQTNPKFEAVGWVEVLRQTRVDPRTSEMIAMDDGIFDLKIEQRTQTEKLLNEALWTSVIDTNPKVRELEWFAKFKAEEGKQAGAKTAAMLAKEDLESNWSVTPRPESRLIRVSMTAGNPENAKDLVQMIVEAHISSQQKLTADRTSGDLQTAKLWQTRYSREMQNVKDQMSRLQGTLNAGGGTPNAGRANVIEIEIGQLITAAMKSKLDSNTAQAQLAAMEAAVQAGNEPAQVEQMVQMDQTVARIKAMVDELDLQLESYNKQGTNSPFIQELTNRRNAAVAKLKSREAEARATYRNQLLDSMRSMVQSGRAEEEALNALIDTKRTQLGEISTQLSNFFSLKEEFDSYKILIREMDDRVALLENALRQQSAGVRWSNMPITPDQRSSPKLSIYMPVAIMLGLALSLGLAFLKELMDTSVRSPRDLQKVGSMSLLGMIASENDDPQLAGVPLHLVISQAPHSIMSEQFRQVRTRLQHAVSLDTTRTIVVTSPGPGDGKTTVACNLAAGLALNGRRILLVDANFRRPELHRLFNVPNEVGFTTVLDSVSSLESSVHKTGVLNLEVLTTGSRATNPTELLESQLFSDFIDRALEEYDHVIFDTGPLLVVSEAVALAPRVDGVVTVVRARKNSRGMLTRVRDTLKQIKAEHLGVVLNGVQNWGGGYYGRNIKTYYAYQNAE